MNRPTGNVLIYQADGGHVQVEARFEEETVWLSQAQLCDLFDKNKRTISEHIRNIFKEGELQEHSVVRKSRTTAADGKSYGVNHYNLDVIISVGYRVKSQRGTQFRIWASAILKQYLTQGYALNQQKLQEQQEKLADLRQAIALSSRLIHNKDLSINESQGILAILEKYSHALTVLDDYDHQRLTIEGTQALGHPKLSYEEAIGQIQLWRDKENLGGLFGNEKDDSFKSSLATIYQTFGGAELYPSIEEKAANLLYFIVKNPNLNGHKWKPCGSAQRIKNIAQDIVSHFEARQEVFAGKGMIVSMSRRIAVDLYEEIIKLKPEWHSDDLNKGVINVVMTASSSDGSKLAKHHTTKQQRSYTFSFCC
jgi:hypothetical protein